MKTVSIYQKTDNGMLQLGSFTPKKYYSVRSISEQFMAKHPNANPQTLYIKRRGFMPGIGIVDMGELIPFEVQQ